MTESFVEILANQAKTTPERIAYRFLVDGEIEEAALRSVDLDRKARSVAARLTRAGARGERVLILVPPGVEYLVSFLGCLYAGTIAVPMAPPRGSRGRAKLRAVHARAEATFALADAATRNLVVRWNELPKAVTWLDVSEMGTDEASDAAFALTMPEWDDLAFLQFTSGSTGNPKGVQVSHGNLIANARRAARSFGDDENTIFVSWLPPYHDMGLIGGILQPLFLGCASIVMTPTAFAQRPMRWLETISNYRATTSGGPDFAYALCADVAASAPDDLDLSSWTNAFSGAEPVRAVTLDRFARAFARAGFDRRAFYPCYGMAETTLFVSGGTRFTGARTLSVAPDSLEQGRIVPDAKGRRIVSCGPPAMDTFAIVDRETYLPLPQRTVGEVWVRGPQVASGYWGDEEATKEAFEAKLANDDASYLRTGDLGFLDQGDLFLTGRVKDLIILRGRNLYPSDLETTASNAHEVLRSSGVAAFSVEPDEDPATELGGVGQDTGERLVLVAEVARAERHRLDGEAVGTSLRSAIIEEHGADPSTILFIRPGALPRTSSGKVMRLATRHSYLENKLPVLASWHRPTQKSSTMHGDEVPVSKHIPMRSSLRDQLIQEVANAVGLAPGAIDPKESWAAHGLDSLKGIQLIGRLSERLGRKLSPTLLYDHPTIDAFTDYLMAEDADGSLLVQASAEHEASEGIAVIGIASRFPGGEDARSWFSELVNGVDAVGSVPADRPGADAWQAAAERNPALARAGFLPEVDVAEVALFGLSSREARNVDPQHRLLLETAWRAFEDAGLAPERLKGSSTGVFVGISSPDYVRLMAVQGADRHGRLPVHAGTGNALSVAANRISFTFDLRGPSLAIDTACSSSLVAVHQACTSLERGEAELALAGGVNLLLAPDLSEIFAEAGMLSPDGQCKTFDAAADGYVRGEGCGLLVLKPLKRAQADGDRVLAVIRGSAVNQDGRSNGLTAPNGAAQQAVIRAALSKAGITADDVYYVEAHGTGTSLGDPIEAEALRSVFGERSTQGGPLRIGSVKTNIGHLEAAAGAAGLVKVVLALAAERLPGQLHFEKPNPHAPVRRAGSDEASAPASTLEVLTETVPWPADRSRIAGVSSFGFGGTNAHVIVEGPPILTDDEDQESGFTPTARGLWLSERDPDALTALARAASQALLDDQATLGSLARETSAGRARFDERLAVVAEGEAEAAQALAAWVGGEPSREVIVPPPGAPRDDIRVAFAFPGQGAQLIGMGSELYSRDAAFRRRLDHCDRVLREAADFSLLEVLQGKDETAAARLAETRFTQPALFAVELSLAEVLIERGVRPDRLIGHSVGEYVAACLAGVFGRDDALRLVARRAELVQSLPSGGAMLAVRMSAASAASKIAGHDNIAMAVDNGAERSVLSGALQALEPIASELTSEGVEIRWLTVSHAFHSPLLDPILPAFREAVESVTLRAPRLDIFSNVTGQIAGDEMATPDYWVRQLREPVRFREGLEALLQDPLDALIEVGPRATSLALARDTVSADRADDIAWLPTLRKGVREDVGVARVLGELFVRGVALDGLAANEGVCAEDPGLPGVRFRRERLWFASGTRSALKPHPAGPDEHPLLGAVLNLPEPKAHRFESVVAPASPGWLTDHRIGQSIVMPAAAFVEIALAAGQHALANGATPDRAFELRDLSFKKALMVPQDHEMRLHTIATTNEMGEVRVQTLATDSEAVANTWTDHAEAVVTICSDDSVLPQNTEPAKPEVEERAIGLDELTRRFEDVGLHYGESFRGIERLVVQQDRAGNSVAVGIVRIAPGTFEEPYALPPTRLDACLQTLTPLIEEQETLLPVGIGRLLAWPARGGWPERVEVRTWLTGFREANLEVRTLTGEYLAVLEGVTLAALPGVDRTAEETSNALHAVEWIPSELAPMASEATAPESAGVFNFLTGSEWIAGLESALEPQTSRTESRTEAVFVAPSFDAATELPERAARILEEALDSVRSWLSNPSTQATDRLTFITRDAVPIAADGTWTAPSSSGVAEAGLWGLARALRVEQPKRTVRIIDVGDRVSVDVLARELATEDREDEIALRSGGRFVPRLVPRTLDGTGPTRLEVAVPGHLDQLIWRPMERRAPRADEVEVEVRATGLNFRDLLQALGMLGTGYAEDLQQAHIPFGFECAGTVARVGSDVDHVSPGDPVIGCFTPGGLTSHVTMPAKFVVPKLSELGWAQAAALPTAWLTVWHALDNLAKLTSGEWILIHAAAGGVGCAAVRHALERGARVIATAHPSKWDRLRAMGVEHIASSRDAVFAERVREWTDGAGVEVVLNCLKDELAIESLAVTAQGGRFVELGRVAGLDPETSEERRPDVHYHAFDLGQLALEGEATLDTMIQRFTEPGAAKRFGLPTTAFPIDEAETAFRQLQAGRHVGKLVLVRDSLANSADQIHATGCYVLSGGTGGLGLAVARWLVDRGAGHVALLARRPPSPEVQEEIDAIAQNGARVGALAVDVGDREALRKALSELRDMSGSIRGVIHGAAVFADGLLENLDPAKIRRVFEPKVRGVHHLAEETASDPLDFFVSFSSTAALFGSPGQTNYAAANAILDAYAAQMRGEDRPGMSIAWGPWASIGAAARKRTGSRLASIGIQEIEPAEGLAIFGEALASRINYLAVAPMKWNLFAKQPFAVRPFFGQLTALSDHDGAEDELILDLANLDGAERRETLDEHLRGEIAIVLGLSSAGAVGERDRLMDLGMDSLMAVELKTRLERSFGFDLQSTLLFDHPTVESLVAYLDERVEPRIPDSAQERTESMNTNGSHDASSANFGVLSEDDATMMDDLAELSDDDILRRLRGA